MSDEVRISLRSFIPVISSLVLSWLLTMLSLGVRLSYLTPIITPVQEPEPTAPPSEALSNPAPYLNVILIVGLITISGLIMLYLARRLKRFFRILVGILIWLIGFGVTVIYVINLSLAFDWTLLRLLIPLSALVSSIVTYLMLRRGGLASLISAAYIASGAGATIGMSIPYWTFLVLIVGISAYDVLAVYKGHLSTLSKEEAISLRGLTVELDDLVIGLGDLFFYSLSASAILWHMGVIPALAATASIIVGYTVTLLLLQRKRILPGLPLPLLLGLSSAFLAKLLTSLV